MSDDEVREDAQGLGYHYVLEGTRELVPANLKQVVQGLVVVRTTTQGLDVEKGR